MPAPTPDARRQAGAPGSAVPRDATPAGAREAPARSPAAPNDDQVSGTPHVKPPVISLPKGGGALRGIGETFRTDPSRGTASLSIPIAVSPGRGGAAPELGVSYDSGSGMGAFGLGWSLSLPAITRRTDRGIPLYDDEPASTDADVFVLSGAEDLVAQLEGQGHAARPVVEWRNWQGRRYRVARYRPRIEGLFARIEHWTEAQSGESHWRTISRDNVTSLYGTSSESRIADPHEPQRIFSWLICETHDPKGHLTLYEYKAEDSAGVAIASHAERNRTERARTANRYLKRIRYGNRVSTLVDLDQARRDFMFELVLDYGEHDAAAPTPEETAAWPARDDPFSVGRAGFEVRTYRLCRRVLMFHHFADEPAVGRDCLVAATEFVYGAAGGDLDKGLSCLRAVTHSRFRRHGAGYLRKALPSVEFEYSLPVLSGEVREMPARSLENLPQGLAATPGWVDLDGEGLSGLLVQEGRGWFYKRNLGEGRLGPLEMVRQMPSTANLGARSQQLLDLDGDGSLELVDLEGPTPGFYARDEQLRWTHFSPFRELPNLDWDDPNVRFLDLDGDGFADVLITGDDALVWHRSRRREGFGTAERRAKPHDEEHGPRVVFGEPGQSIFLADMTGDGLTDLVRVTHREICYWPNLGHGRFGRKIAMDHAPQLAPLEAFDARRVRLADIDGSGPTDLIYLGSDGVSLFPNQHGDAWGPEYRLPPLPLLDNLAEVAVVDLLGRGAACLVWSSRDPADAGRHVRYVDLMPAGKPHLLTSVRNNLGAETRIGYLPSTHFYLDDRAAGRPWKTRLPFPVQVVERVETFDHVSGSLFVSRFAYHHGYFDGHEREFRGFALVERWDTETYELLALPRRDAAESCNIDMASHRPPVLTRTWFHVGQLDHDDGPAPTRLAQTVLPPGLSLAEQREACRALKGSTLREEVYGLDGSASEDKPYTVREQNFTVRALQRRGPNPHAVFLVHPRETLESAHERQLADPRISHSVVLAADDFGNVLSAVAIAYGRRLQGQPLLSEPDRARQERTHVVLTRSTYTAALDRPDIHLAPLPASSDKFEIVAATETVPLAFDRIDALVGQAASMPEDACEEDDLGEASERMPRRRLIGRSLSLYRRDDLAGVLALGTAESLALPYESYTLTFSDDLARHAWGSQLGDGLDAVLTEEGGYVRLAGATGWWAPSGRTFFSASAVDGPAELEEARRGFFLAQRYLDPFAAETVVTYDRHRLLPLESRDALGNRVTAGERTADGETTPRLDYRVLQPAIITDINRNRTAAAFDVLGTTVGTAVMGKLEEALGDTLEGFEADLDDAAVAALLADPKAGAAAALGGATSRHVHDLFAFSRRRGLGRGEPLPILTMARERHLSDLAAGESSPVRVSLSYFDGFNREIQTKVEAEPGPLDGADGSTVSDRWTTTGWTVFDNKGQPVRRYEPFFDDTHRFRFGRKVGVSSILFRDPLGRVIGTLRPDHAFEKTRFDTWSQENWDANDTCLVDDPRRDEDLGGHFQRLGEEEFLPTWRAQRIDGGLGPLERDSAEKASAHAATPDRMFVDALGRVISSVSHNRTVAEGAAADQFTSVRTIYDALGNVRRTIDAFGRVFAEHVVDLVGRRLADRTLDGAWRRTLPDIEGTALRAWDARGHVFRNTYDALRRPLASWVTGARRGEPAREILYERTDYGDGSDAPAADLPPEARNLRGKPWRRRDTAGELTIVACDFKGNTLSEARRLACDYRQAPDWSTEVALEAESHATAMVYDAMNRVVQVAPAHRPGAPLSVVRMVFNEARLLERVAVALDLPEQPAPPLDPAAATIKAVTRIEYDAHGRRTAIVYGNGVSTRYGYDSLTFRLRRMVTTREAATGRAETLQDLAFTYDAMGHTTHVGDAAQPAVFFRNLRVGAEQDYVYDALYRLVRATGREHLSQAAPGPAAGAPVEPGRAGLPLAGDGEAMGRYDEHYAYDLVGNILSLVHRTDAAIGGWTRRYRYDVDAGNRLLATAVGDEAPTSYAYDGHGNTTALPHLSRLDWDFEDRLAVTARQVVNDGTPETTWYVYDSTGQRLRKVTERAAQSGEAPRRLQERLYLGGLEILRRYEVDGETVALERETLHVMDGEQRIALVETVTRGECAGKDAAARLVRYQLANQVGSATVEVDEAGAVISYEEFHPFGSTAYEMARPGLESAKRYRFLGKERDEENGLSYHGARYYAPWLTRWLSPDPAGADGPDTPYAYAHNPISLADFDGEAPESVESLLAKGRQNIKDIDLRFKADFNDIAQYSQQGRSRWSSIWSSWKKGVRLTENEHIIAGGGLRRLDPRFIYRKAVTLIVDREYAVGKTLGDRRLVGLVKKGMIDAGEFLKLSKANALRAYDNMVAQKGIFGAPLVTRENVAKVADLQIAETLKSIPATTRVSKFSATMAKVGEALSDTGKVGKLLKVAKPVVKVIKPLAVVATVFSIGIKTAHAAEGGPEPAPDDKIDRMDKTAKKVEEGLDIGLTAVGLSGPAGLVVLGGEASMAIMPHVGSEERIVDAGKATEDFARRHGSDNPEAWGATAAGATSMIEGASVYARLSHPIGWVSLGVDYYLHKK